MTPIEKAQEIIDKMEQVVQPWESNRCALIAVEEIIKSNPGGGYMTDTEYIITDTTEFWKEVKKEIENTLE